MNRKMNFARRTWLRTAAMGLGMTLGLATQAQTAWPAQPLRIMVPAPAGGTSDIVMRLVGEQLSKSLKQAVIIDNRPGALGGIAVDALMSAPHDGNTFIFAPSSLVTEVPYSVKTKYDAFKDLAPVAEIATIPLVLVTNANLPIKNLAEMIAYVKARPGKTSYASYSPGTISHVKGLQFNKAAGTDMLHIGYKGTPPALQDVMGGQVEFMFDGVATSVPYVRSGKLRALAVTSAKRSAILPDVPTFAELGYPDLTQIIGMGIWATADTPADIKAKMRVEVQKVLGSAALKERFDALGLEMSSASQTPEDWSKSLKRDYEYTGQVLRSINYRPE